jgi:UDP-N-acetylglucosamine 2-epimerase (non-hydrolysing)
VIAIILGTRPEIIKMSPIIRECERRQVDYFIVHTGQHYSYEMDRVFFSELELPQAQFNLDVGSGTHGVQTGKIMAGVERVFEEQRPDIALVQGDTNTVLAAAIAAAKLHIPVGHVEAGLRSFDRSMPEEINRVLADHISTLLFAPTATARQNLLSEGLADSRISVTGNTIVDAVSQNLEISQRKQKILQALELEPLSYFLVTAHRAENVDSRSRLSGILGGLEEVGREYGLPVLFPVHPRTMGRIHEFGLSPEGIDLITPLGFLEFLQVEANARLILTDSGGVQEESCILGVPCVTLRENTERPETIEVGANVLAGTSPDRIIAAAHQMDGRRGRWKNPFGDGRAGERIVDLCLSSPTGAGS